MTQPSQLPTPYRCECPYCNAQLKHNGTCIGQMVKCPGCKKPFPIPKIEKQDGSRSQGADIVERNVKGSEGNTTDTQKPNLSSMPPRGSTDGGDAMSMNMKTSFNGEYWGCAAFAVLLVVGLAVAMSPGDKEAIPPPLDKPVRIDGGIWCGYTDDAWLKSMEYRNDRSGFEVFFRRGLRSGDIKKFRHGEVVYVIEYYLIDGETFTGWIKVRCEGDTQEYWTTAKVIE